MSARITGLKELQKRNRLLEQALRQKEKEIYSIERIGKALSSTLNLNELLLLIVQEMNSLMDADRCTLFVVDHERQEIWSKVALRSEIKEIRLPVGEGISGYVAETGETINIPDAYQDQRFDPETDRKTGYHTRSILCMPVWEPVVQGEDPKILGVLQVLNKKSGRFTEADESLLEALAAQVAISITNSRLCEDLLRRERLSIIGQLMSSVLHDIRGPVDTICGFVDLMEDKSISSVERGEFATIIREEIKSITLLVGEVLDFAKGKREILPRKTSAKKLLNRFMPRLEQMCKKNYTRLTVVNDSRQLIYVDEEKLNRVLYNITKNALEAMGEGGDFMVEVYDDECEVVFQFSDTGPGIPPDFQSRLFDTFVTSRKESGTGLGLAIVKKVIEEHQGKIQVNSCSGEGVTFLIKLPVYAKN